MTGHTVNALLPFPEPTDPLATYADQVQDLADAIYPIRDIATYTLAGALWTVSRFEFQQVLGKAFLWMIVDCAYVGAAAMTADIATDTAPGNITDKPIATIGTPFRPSAEVNGIPMQRPGVNTWWGSLQTDGLFKLTHGPTNGKIPVSNVTPTPFKVRALIPRID